MSNPHPHSAGGATQPPEQPGGQVGRATASQLAALLVKMLTASAVSMTVVLPFAFVLSYMLNDVVSWTDYAVALVIVVGAVFLLVGIQDDAVRDSTRLSPGRCFAIGLGAQALIPLLLGSIYALLSMLPSLDSAVGYTASNATCLVLFAILGIASTAALTAARGLLR